MKDQSAKRVKFRQNLIKPNMALRGIHFFAFVRVNRLRQKRRREENKRRRRRRREEEEEEEEEEEKRKEEELKVCIYKEFWYEFVY